VELFNPSPAVSSINEDQTMKKPYDPFKDWTPEMLLEQARACHDLARRTHSALWYTEAAHWRAAAERKQAAALEKRGAAA